MVKGGGEFEKQKKMLGLYWMVLVYVYGSTRYQSANSIFQINTLFSVSAPLVTGCKTPKKITETSCMDASGIC